MTQSPLKVFLESSYERFNRPEYIDPDPLLAAREFAAVEDREIIGLVASALAVGRAQQIVLAARDIISRMHDEPRAFLDSSSYKDLREAFKDFRYRFFSGDDIASLLLGIKGLLDGSSSLGAVFSAMVKPGDESVLPALSLFVAEITAASKGGGMEKPFVKNLLPSPAGGSACKRPLLFLRWMIRKDAVDPGGWDARLAPLLVQPMDTHMAWVARRFGFTSNSPQGSSPDLKVALEVTRRFSEIQPGDPVKYDFCLTRPGIRPELDRDGYFQGDF